MEHHQLHCMKFEQDCGEQKCVDLLATKQVIDLQLAFLLGLVEASV